MVSTCFLPTGVCVLKVRAFYVQASYVVWWFHFYACFGSVPSLAKPRNVNQIHSKITGFKRLGLNMGSSWGTVTVRWRVFVAYQATTSGQHTLVLDSFEGKEYEGALLFVTLSVNNFACQSIEEIDPVD